MDEVNVTVIPTDDNSVAATPPISTNPATVTPIPPTVPQSQETVEDSMLDNKWLRWKCLVCGYIYEGVKPKTVCPKCGNSNPDKFVDQD